MKQCENCTTVAPEYALICHECGEDLPKKYDIILHFPGGHHLHVVAEGANVDEAIARAKETEQVAPTVATTTRRI